MADPQDRADFTALTKVKEEPMDVETVDSAKEEVSSAKIGKAKQFRPTA